MGAGLEPCGHCGVHRDHDLTLLGHEGVALLLLVLDPLFEGLPNHGRTDVDDPSLGDLCKVTTVWEVRFNEWLASNELEDLLQREALVLRYVQGLDLGVVELSLPPRQYIFEEVDRDVFYMQTKMDEYMHGFMVKFDNHLPYGGR